MASRKALGRGLSALIPTAAAPPPRVEPPSSELEEHANAPLFISIAKIAPNPTQPRKVFRESELSDLAASIREQGILQPLVVRRRGDGYELIIGERRWRASQIAGLDEVPAVILDASDRQVVEMALVENVQRADLNPMELAEAFRVLVNDEQMTQDEVGRRVGLDRSSVANHLRLLELPAPIQQDLIDQRISMGHAKAILQVPGPQRTLVRDQIVRQGLSVRAAEDLGRRAASSTPHRPRPGPSRDVHVIDLEERLRKALKTKVRIVGRRTRGRIELEFHGESELERLSERLLGGES
jgi:ParB family transcriptional regulator, chromosome partitioning protein